MQQLDTLMIHRNFALLWFSQEQVVTWPLALQHKYLVLRSFLEQLLERGWVGEWLTARQVAPPLLPGRVSEKNHMVQRSKRSIGFAPSCRYQRVLEQTICPLYSVVLVVGLPQDGNSNNGSCSVRSYLRGMKRGKLE